MSRSYKKHFIWKDKSGKDMKKYFNRRLRRQKLRHNLHHKAYRKNAESWEICDYKFRESSFEQYFQNRIRFWKHSQNFFWGKQEKFPNRREVYKEWIKWYKRK